MIIAFDKLETLREKYKGKTIVLGSGVFDLLHYGHVSYLRQLKEYGDIVVVMTKSDLRIKTHKSPLRPIIPEQDRAKMVDALKGVDYVFIGPYKPDTNAQLDQTYEAAFAALHPDVFVTTNDEWKKLKAITQARIVTLPRTGQAAHGSTTAIIEHIKAVHKS